MYSYFSCEIERLEYPSQIVVYEKLMRSCFTFGMGHFGAILMTVLRMHPFTIRDLYRLDQEFIDDYFLDNYTKMVLVEGDFKLLQDYPESHEDYARQKYHIMNSAMAGVIDTILYPDMTPNYIECEFTGGKRFIIEGPSEYDFGLYRNYGNEHLF